MANQYDVLGKAPGLEDLNKLSPNDVHLTIRGLNAGYGKMEILHNFDLTVSKAQSLCLIGPNGAGKSTFINILSGITTKTSGDVNVWGFNLDKNPRQVRASLGIVPQEINVDPFFTPKNLLKKMHM